MVTPTHSRYIWNFFWLILDIFGLILDILEGLLNILIQILANFQIILPLLAYHDNFFTAFVIRIWIKASVAQQAENYLQVCSYM